MKKIIAKSFVYLVIVGMIFLGIQLSFAALPESEKIKDIAETMQDSAKFKQAIEKGQIEKKDAWTYIENKKTPLTDKELDSLQAGILPKVNLKAIHATFKIAKLDRAGFTTQDGKTVKFGYLADGPSSDKAAASVQKGSDGADELRVGPIFLDKGAAMVYGDKEVTVAGSFQMAGTLKTVGGEIYDKIDSERPFHLCVTETCSKPSDIT